ncbi:MAG: hypothetical protein WC810_26670 [Janthinobacterium sp.]|jgi:hypothetical protein
MKINETILTWSAITLGAFGTAYAAWVSRKSKRFKEAEEGDKFIESAVKLTNIWEKLSKNLQNEIEFLRKESQAMNEKYTQLKIDFEVTKAKSDFVIEQLKLENELLKVENERMKSENREMRGQLGIGSVKSMRG